MTERLPNTGEAPWQNVLGANDGSGGFLRVTLNDDGTLRPTLGQTITVAAITANTDDWNPTGLSTASVIRVPGTSGSELRGLTAPSPAVEREIIIENTGTTPADQITLVDNATTSASANRFYVPGGDRNGGKYTLYAGTSVELKYSVTDTRWWMPSYAAASITSAAGALPLAAGTAAVGNSPFFSKLNHVHPLGGASTLISDQTVTGAASATIDFPAISGSYAHLFGIAYTRIDTATGTGAFRARINAVSAASSYDYTAVRAINATPLGAPAGSQTDIYLGETPDSSAAANVFGGAVFFVPHYAGTTNRKFIISGGGGMDTESLVTTLWYVGLHIGKSRANTAITQLTFGCGTFGTNKFAVGSRITLYGIGT